MKSPQKQGRERPASTARASEPLAATNPFRADLIAHLPRLRHFARSMQRDPAVADDLVQEAVLRAWAAQDRFTPGTNMIAWLYTILKRLHFSHLRRNRFVAVYDEALERTLVAPETQSDTVALREVACAMAKLGENQRIVLEMIALQELSYEEVAFSLDIPLGTVKSRVMRAREALTAMLDQKGSGDGADAADDDGFRPVRDDKEVRSAARQRWRTAKARGLRVWIG